MIVIFQMIKKYGLKYCDLETMIRNVNFMLRVLAINIDARNKNPPYVLRFTSAILIANYYYTFIFSAAWCIISGRAHNAAATAVITSIALTSHISVIKLWCMYINHGAIQKVVTKYLDCNSEVDPNSRFGRNIYTKLRVVKKRAIIFWCVIITNVIVYIATPLFRTGRHLLDDYLVFYGLDPILESPNYEIAKLINISAMFVTAYAPANINGFFIIVCGYTEAHMSALSKELEDLWNDALEYGRTKTEETMMARVEDMDKFIADRLVCIAKGHIANMELIYKVEEIFQVSLAIGLISLMCGLIADLLGGLETTYIQIPYSLFIVGMDCLAGQRVMEASIIFEKAVYACNWQNFSPSNRRIVYLILINAQKTMTLSAGTVTKLNFETFAGIIKTVYSAYAALRSAVY